MLSNVDIYPSRTPLIITCNRLYHQMQSKVLLYDEDDEKPENQMTKIGL